MQEVELLLGALTLQQKKWEYLLLLLFMELIQSKII